MTLIWIILGILAGLLVVYTFHLALSLEEEERWERVVAPLRPLGSSLAAFLGGFGEFLHRGGTAARPHLVAVLRRLGQAAAVLLVLLVIAAVVGHLIIADRARTLVEEEPERLAFAGGLMAFACVATDVADNEETFDEILELQTKVANASRRYPRSLRGVAELVRDLRRESKDPVTYVEIYEQVVAVHAAYKTTKRIREDAHAVALALPAYDEQTESIKQRTVAMTGWLNGLGFIDLLFLDEEVLEVKEAEFEVLAEEIVEWIGDDILFAYPFDVHASLGLLVLYDLGTEPGIDEGLRRSDAFEYARAEGCLQGDNLPEAIGTWFENLD